ncbi:MAG: HAMP domain-containing histidine kinase [Alphaproteobacteria bacterium]|nr:HAMP domain-containing histidine kinase [Alphaproteobacteria bacterium]
MAQASRSSWISMLTGLSGKVLALTIVFVMLGEVLIFLPSIANFRIQWLKTHVAQAEIAVLAAEAAPGQIVDADLRSTILKGAGVEAVSLSRENQRKLVLRNTPETMVKETFDLRSGNYFPTIGDAFAVMFLREDRLISVIDKPPAMSGDYIELTLHEWPMRDAMLAYGLRILNLSIALSLIVAALIFAALRRVLVKPMQGLSANMMAFGHHPENPGLVIAPSPRRDEIGIAERELQSMQLQLQDLLKERGHLAALGLAVSKVSHDLRNMLTSAQLISDRLGEVKDPTVQRFAPKLISSLDRAIMFLNQTITYGKAQELPPRREWLVLRDVVEEVIESARLQAGPNTLLENLVRPRVKVDCDREHLLRTLTNLTRNALQAIETGAAPQNFVRITSERRGAQSVIAVEDSGPGIPQAVRAKLFEAFQSSARAGGTGLGLAISAELIKAHGGEIQVARSDETGTIFEIILPDRTA